MPRPPLDTISGVAASVQKITSSRYLAGLWEDNLMSDLQWKLSPTLRDDAGPTLSSKDFRFRLLRTMPAYRVLTFSWASIDSVAENDKSSVDNHSQIDAVIMDAQCTPKEPILLAR